MSTLIGTNPNQVPVNGYLGTLAFQDSNAVNITGGAISGTQAILTTPATAPTLTVNSTMSFELTSNTSLKIVVRGTDGTTRSVSLTLA